MEDQRMQHVSAVGVADSVRRWHAEAGHIRNLATQRRLQAEQRAVLLREVRIPVIVNGQSVRS